MSKTNLLTITGADNLSAINANFQKIGEALDDEVLYRDNPEGEPNQLKTDVDVNGVRLFNLRKPELPSEPIRLADIGDVTAITEQAAQYAEAAKASEQVSVDAAAQSTQSMSNSATSASVAQTAASSAAQNAEYVANSFVVVPPVIASGSVIQFTNLPAQAKRLVLTFTDVKTTGSTSGIRILGLDAANTLLSGSSRCAELGTAIEFTSASYILATGATVSTSTCNCVLTFERCGMDRWGVMGVGSGFNRSGVLVTRITDGNMGPSTTMDKLQISLASSTFAGGTISLNYWQ